MYINQPKVLRKSSGNVLLVDINGFTRMKEDLNEEEWVSLLEYFFSKCEEILIDLKFSKIGSGLIIGDGILIFSEKMSELSWNNYIELKVRNKLLEGFEIYKKNFNADYLDITFINTYCDFYVRSETDVIGPKIDILFQACQIHEGNNILHI